MEKIKLKNSFEVLANSSKNISTDQINNEILTISYDINNDINNKSHASFNATDTIIFNLYEDVLNYSIHLTNPLDQYDIEYETINTLDMKNSNKNVTSEVTNKKAMPEIETNNSLQHLSMNNTVRYQEIKQSPSNVDSKISTISYISNINKNGSRLLVSTKNKPYQDEQTIGIKAIDFNHTSEQAISLKVINFNYTNVQIKAPVFNDQSILNSSKVNSTVGNMMYRHILQNISKDSTQANSSLKDKINQNIDTSRAHRNFLFTFRHNTTFSDSPHAKKLSASTNISKDSSQTMDPPTLVNSRSTLPPVLDLINRHDKPGKQGSTSPPDNDIINRYDKPGKQQSTPPPAIGKQWSTSPPTSDSSPASDDTIPVSDLINRHDTTDTADLLNRHDIIYQEISGALHVDSSIDDTLDLEELLRSSAEEDPDECDARCVEKKSLV